MLTLALPLQSGQYEISDATKIPLMDPADPKKENPALLALLKALPSDDDWDIENPMRRA